jgi:hypothetical protein
LPESRRLSAHQAAKPQYCAQFHRAERLVAALKCGDVPSLYQIKTSGSEMKIAIASDHAGYIDKEQLKPITHE